MRYIFFTLGIIFATIGVIGIIIPMLPTTPLLVFSAFFLSKSSKKFHKWFLTNKYFGEYIRNYIEKKGMNIKSKIISISFLWITIGTTVIFSVDKLWVQLMLILTAIAVTVHLLMMKTLKNNRRIL